MREPGVQLLNPLIESLQVIGTYGAFTAVLGLIASLIFRSWKPGTLAGAAAATTAFGVAYIWVHSRTLQDQSMFDIASLLASLAIVGGSIAVWLLFRAIANSPKALPISLALAIVPGLLPFTRAVSLDTELQPIASADLPNVTVLLLDTQRADRLSCYGYERPDGKQVSPVIDSLAAQGTRFDWNYSAAPWTRPSIASLFTGLYPTSHQTYGPERALPKWSVTMAEMFHGLGYRTAGFSANANISAVWGFAQGFQEFWCLDDKELIDIVTWGEAVNRLRRVFKLFHETPDNAAIVNEQVFPWIDKVKDGDNPVFTYVQYLDPHFPYHPVEDLLNDNPPDFDDLVSKVDSEATGTFLPYPFQARARPTEEVLQGFSDLYDAEVAFMDRELGKLVERIREAGLLGEDDWLIITSDHGEEFFEHLQWGHGQNLLNEVIRVPLIVVGPGVPEGQVIAEPTVLIDLLPTLAGVVGGESLIEQGLNETEQEDGSMKREPRPGFDLRPIWGGTPTPEPRDIYSEKLRPPVNYAIRRGNHKLVQVENREYPHPDYPNDPKKPLEYSFFYNLEDDPFEMRPYFVEAMEEYDVLAEVRDDFVPMPEDLIEAYGALLTDRLPALQLSAGRLNQGVEQRPMTSSERARLAELGYVH